MPPKFSSKRFILTRSIATVAATVLVATVAVPVLRSATTIYWDGTGTAWNLSASWSTDPAAATPDPAAPPGVSDLAAFSISSITGTPQTVSLNANQTVSGLSFLGTNSASTTLQGGGTNRTLSLGTAGITVNANNGDVTIGSATAGQSVSISLQGAQSWKNDAAFTAFTVNNGVSSGVAGANTLTLTGSNDTTPSTIAGIIANGTGTLGLSKTGAGLWILGGANTFTGGTIVSEGTLRGTVAGSFGANATAGAITLAGGTLELFNNTATAFTSANTTVSASSTVSANRSTDGATSTTHTLGTLSIGAFTLTATRGVHITGTATGGVTFGATTMTDNAIFAPQASTVLTLGAVSGAFRLTQAGTSNGITVLSAASTYSGGTTISGGILQLNNATAAGTGTSIDFAAGGSGRLRIAGGVTIGYNINIAAGQTSSTGEGLLQQTGTGQANVNGTITLSGLTTSGGVLVGGTAVGNELVINGPINGPNIGLTQREGRVIYRGGGTASDNGTTSPFTITNTALVGATNGIPVGLTPSLGGSANATLDLNGFDQAVAGLRLGNATNPFVGTVNLGARTLTLNGDVSTVLNGGANVTHVINATAGGALNFGTTQRNINVNDALASDDLVINAAAITGSGGVNKTGFGTLALNGVNVAGPLAITEGTLATGRVTQPGSFSSQSLAFAASTNLRMKVGTGGDVINTGALSASATTFNLNQLGGTLANGTYPLINYTGASPGLAAFTLAPVGHAAATLVDTGSAIALRVTANDRVIWTGAASTGWFTGASSNWKRQSTQASTDYVESDDVIFADAPLSAVDVFADIFPSNVTFTNTAATSYAFNGTGGIAGATGLTKTGNGTVTLITPNSYGGPTTLAAGTLELDHDAPGNLVLTGTSGVAVAAGAVLRLTRDDGAITFNRNLTGTGTVEINPHSAAVDALALSVALTGTNTGFTGLMRLLSPLSGTYRINVPAPAGLGNASIEVQAGSQVFTADGQTYTNNISLAGTGFADANGDIGALRLGNTSVWAGNIVLNAGARIGAHNGTGTVSGAISGGDLSVNATNYNNGYTVIFTGTNSYGKTIIGGQNTQTGGTPSMRLNIGNGGTTGTLGAGNVVINGDGANGVLGFDRSNGYTLAAGQTITGETGAGTIPNSIARTFIDIDTLGAGFSDNGNTITLGTASIAGGNIRVAQGRANAVGNFSGALTTGVFRVSTGQTGGVANFNAGAVINTNTLNVGDIANASGTVNQAIGTTVNVTEQLRVGHFGTESSVYNLNGGTLTLTGASPNNSPSTAVAGAAGTTGDNNINALATAAIVGGGIYLGIDGTGIFNQNNGTVTTNWVVLDNRGDTGPGANMAGVDQYNLNNGRLNIRSNWGIIGRNVSTEFNLNGGTVAVDNTGTGTGTGANITVPFDAAIKTTGNSTLDTAGAGNAFTLTRSMLGTGTIALTGGGAINLNPSTGTGTGSQLITSGLSGTNAIRKLGAGSTDWRGSGSGYTGAITISAGRLDLPANLAATSVTVADGSVIGGEPTIGAVALGAASGAAVVFDPNTSGSLTATSLTVNGTTTFDFGAVPSGAAPWTALTYGTKTGAGTFAVLNATTYRAATAIDNGAGNVSVSVTRKNLAWTATGGTTWDVNTSSSWDDAGTAEKFFSGDAAAFNDTGAGTVTINSQVSPWGVSVNSSGAYTFSGTGGIAGPGGLSKTGSSTLTLGTANSYSGRTSVAGGTLAFSTSANLGNNSITNTLALSGGATLNPTAGIDLGSNRALAIGTGGGTINLTAAATGAVLTVGGNLTGSESLTLNTGGNGGVIYLTGQNTGFTGNVTVNSATAASTTNVTTLRLGNSNALTAGTLTINNPTTGNSGAATTLDLNGATLPNAVSLSMTALLSGTASYRTQVLSNVPGSTINGPIDLTGTSIVQFNSAAPNGMTLNGNVTASAGGFTNVFFLRGSGTGVLNGVINLPAANLSKTDAGTWTINSTGNTWTSTGVLVGTVTLGATGVLPAGATLTLGQNDGNAASLNLNGFSQTVSSLVSNPTTVGANTTGKSIASATPATLSVNQASTTTYAGTITGSVALVKDGTGSLTLAGTNTNSGATSVNAGTLLVNGSSTATVTTVNAGAVLGGTGILGAVTVVGGAVTPGTIGSTGTLSSSAFSLNSNAVLKFELATAGVAGNGVNDLLSVGGPFTLDGTLQVTELTGFSNGVYRLADYTSTLTNNGLELEPSFIAAHPGSFIDPSIPGQLNLVVVPEPGVGMSLLSGLGMLAGLQRYRRRQG